MQENNEEEIKEEEINENKESEIIIKDNNHINNKEIKNIEYCLKNNKTKFETLLNYYKNKIILNDQKILPQLIEELNLLIESDYGKILLPFLSPPCHELLEAYIESDLDEEESIKSIEDFKYIQIFEKLKKNIFISKENASVIYSYFGSLFYDAKEIEQNDKRLLKFLKVKELWKIFYKLQDKTEKMNKSTINFIGGKLIFESLEKCDLKYYNIIIKINFFSNNNLDNDLEKINFIKINNKNINITNSLKKINNINDLSFIEFQIVMNKIDIFYKIKEQIQKFEVKFTDHQIKTITLLENYYGQVQLITIFIKNKSFVDKSKFYLHYPISTGDQNILCCIQKNNYDTNGENEKKTNNIFDLTSEKVPYELIIENNKLIKVNFINYNEENYNIIENFGGIVQFLPFMSLIKNLYNNDKIKVISSINKNDILSDFVSEILSTFINIIFHYDEYEINISKNNLFFFTIISELDPLLLSKNDIIIKSMNNIDKDAQSKNFLIIEYFLKSLKNENDKSLLDKLFQLNEKIDENFFTHYKCFFRQLYTKLMKELFIYNRNWSIFNKINDNDSKITVKYKQLSYYTKSFQQPFIYPILEMDKYYPPFTNFNKEELFKVSNKKILNYDFSLSEDNKIIKAIDQYLSKCPNFEKCCLVKKIYHVKGKVGIVKNIEDNNESFDIIFKSNNNEVEYTCNKDLKSGKNKNLKIFNSQLREKTKYVCYGSTFGCPKREYNRVIKIKSDEILFLLIREYCHRVSGIEIFTINNKSYYFNFNQKFQIEKKSLLVLYSHLKRKAKRSWNKTEIEIDSDNENEIDEKNNINEINNINENNNNNNEINDINENNNNDEDNNKDIEIEQKILKQIKNVILSNINLHKFDYIVTQDKFIGYYNKKYVDYLFPLFDKKLFSQKMQKYQHKNKYLSNYDILTYINIFSNRSFKDLYQYPVFPMLYDIINKKRVMNKHIGHQDLDEQSHIRLEIINDSYRTAKEEYEDNQNMDLPRLFSTHYSNPIYTANFLIRIFPYSFCAIELQGDGFDNPNRLFYSVDGSMINTLNQKSDLRELIPEMFYFFELFKNKNDLKFNRLTNDKEIDTVLIQNDRDENDRHIYKFLADMRNFLEKEEKLDEWIDLIFGIKQEKDDLDRNYYEKESYVSFENKEEILNDEITMQSTDFGLLPYKIFDIKFPPIRRINTDKLEQYNNLMIEIDHFEDNSNPMKCFMCIGRANIDKDYLKFYKNEKLSYDIKNFKEINEFYYYFVGNIFGNVTIYKLEPKFIEKKKLKLVINFIKNLSKRKDKNDEGIELNSLNNNDKLNINKEKEKKINKEDDIMKDNYEFAKTDGFIDDSLYKYTIYKKLYDHKKQIKYIDYNRRLNLFVTYSIDEYINIYFFPSCKLIKSIKISNIIGKNNIFNKVLLVSTPFPMIFCSNEFKIYIFDINCNLIHNVDVNDSNREFKLHIDKNCGIVQDYLSINGIKYSFPFIEQIIT